MFAVRRALTRPEVLRDVVRELVASGAVDGKALDQKDPLGFLGDVRDAAYRFCAHEPGIDVVLTGTGSVEHLEQNVASLGGPPLDADQATRLLALFGAVDSVSGG
jgi:L-galactose dehydrogenase